MDNIFSSIFNQHNLLNQQRLTVGCGKIISLLSNTCDNLEKNQQYYEMKSKLRYLMDCAIYTQEKGPLDKYNKILVRIVAILYKFYIENRNK
jgi:hypothetical protein